MPLAGVDNCSPLSGRVIVGVRRVVTPVQSSGVFIRMVPLLSAVQVQQRPVSRSSQLPAIALP